MISVIIVSWNTRELTLRCLQSVCRHFQGEFEIILVDNASSDDTLAAVKEQFPLVEIIANDRNRGYAQANNQAIHRVRGDLVLLLNSDCQITTAGSDQELTRYFSVHPECGVAGALLFLPNGDLQTGKRVFNTAARVFLTQICFFDALRNKKPPSSSEAYETDYVDGAFLCARKELFQQVGLLDESFFMYAEDMEWCARVKARGWAIRVLPTLAVVHHHAQSAKKDYCRMLLHNAVNNCRFIRLTQGRGAAHLAYAFYLGGMLIRVFLSVVRRNGLARDYWCGFRTTFANWKHLHARFNW